MESMPSDGFSYILDFVGYEERKSVQVCSRSCNALWLDHANKETRRLYEEFLRPFQFEAGLSPSQCYYAISKAYKELNDYIDELCEVTNRGRQDNAINELGLMVRVENLLNRNPSRSREREILVTCTDAISMAFHFDPESDFVEDISVDSVTMHRALPLLQNILLPRSYNFDVEVTYKVLLLLYLISVKTTGSHGDSWETMFRGRLEVGPWDSTVAIQFALYLLHRGETNRSFEVCETAIELACEDVHTSFYASAVCEVLTDYADVYGMRRSIKVLEETLWLQECLLPEARSSDLVDLYGSCAGLSAAEKLELKMGRVTDMLTSLRATQMLTDKQEDKTLES